MAPAPLCPGLGDDAMHMGDERRCLFYGCAGGVCATPVMLNWLLGEEGGGQREQSLNPVAVTDVSSYIHSECDFPRHAWGKARPKEQALPLLPSPALCPIYNLKASEKGELPVLPGQPCVLLYPKVLELISASNLPGGVQLSPVPQQCSLDIYGHDPCADPRSCGGARARFTP